MIKINPTTLEEIIKTLELGLERGDLISIGDHHLNVFEASMLVTKLKRGLDKQGLDLHMTYAEMSYLRDVVRKDKLERSRELFKLFVPKDTDVNIVNQKSDEYWSKQKRSPPITQEACIMLLLEKFDQLEDKCREALKVE
jgi:hypothetical protein